MPTWLRWTLGLAVAALLIAVPYVRYRAVYVHSKRLREVAPGKVYRSGQLTVAGFTDAVIERRIRTIINLQEDFPDPDIEMSYFDRSTMKESAMCQQLGVRYVFIAPDLLHRNELSMHRPKAIDQFLALLDDPTVYPILLHCKAGLHRTGVMVAVYRMEKEGWTPQEALREAKANGFGEWNCTSANDYVAQYVIGYRGQRSEVGGQRSEVRGQRSEVGGQRSEVRGQKSEVTGARRDQSENPAGGSEAQEETVPRSPAPVLRPLTPDP